MRVNRTHLTKVILLAGALVTTACASQYRKRDDEAAKKIKSAAVIAFIVKEPASDVTSLSLNTGRAGKRAGGSSFYKPSDAADALYQDFSESVTKATGWKLASRLDVSGNAVYTTVRKQMMAPVEVLFLPQAGENWFKAHDIMVPKAAENLGRDGRNQLLAALGVDAVVVTTVNVAVKGGFSLNGLGPRRPQASFDMKIYERDRDEPIWIEGVTGKKSEESLGWLGSFDEERLKQLARVSAQDAFGKIGSKIE